jgi:UDP-glucuronate decarboxylase
MGMRILVTGAAGFLGSNLTSHLLDLGHEVIGLDDLSTGRLENLSEAKYRKFEFIEADIREAELPAVDGIFNLACPASPVHYQFDPVKTLETNVLGTLNVLRHSRKHKIRMLQASTSEVYGDPLVSPQKEDYWGNVNPIGIRSCYDEGKRASETLCFDYLRQHEVDARVIRIFNTYGPKMAVGDGRVVSNFIVQALRSEDITIYGDGSQTRSFCFVDDLIHGMSSVFFHDTNIHSPINLGNPVEFSMVELAEAVIRLSGSESKLVNRPLPQDDPKQRKPDISLATDTFQWIPSIPLENGLERTISYFKNRI